MKIFASDYDGTLYHYQDLDKHDIEMIRVFREAGGIFGFATGRPISSIIEEAKKYGIDYDFIVGLNGGHVVDNKGVELHKFSIAEDVALRILELMEANTPLFVGVTDGHLIHAHISKREFDDFASEKISLNTILENKVAGFFAEFPSVEEARVVTETVNSLFKGEAVAQQNGVHVDVSGYGASKSSGLNALFEHMKWDHDVYVIGDSNNDVDMIQSFYGFAMENGIDEVKDHARHIVKSVADAIKHIL